MSFIWFIFIGLISGLIAGKLMRGGGFGWLVNLIVGVAGAYWAAGCSAHWESTPQALSEA